MAFEKQQTDSSSQQAKPAVVEVGLRAHAPCFPTKCTVPFPSMKEVPVAAAQYSPDLLMYNALFKISKDKHLLHA